MNLEMGQSVSRKFWANQKSHHCADLNPQSVRTEVETTPYVAVLPNPLIYYPCRKMTLSVQKNYPFPPAIVIELPNSSPGNSSYGSREDLEGDSLGALNEATDGKFPPIASSPTTKSGNFLLPTIISTRDLTNPRATSGNYRGIGTEQKNEAGQNGKSNFRGSRQSVSSAAPQIPRGHRSSSKETSVDCGLLDVPRTAPSLSHSHSLRSAKSYKEQPTCFLYPESGLKRHGLLSECSGSTSCCGMHPKLEHACIPFPPHYTHHTPYYPHYPYPIFPHEDLSGSNLSQLSAMEAMRETCNPMYLHANAKGFRPDRPHKTKRTSLTPTYSSSDASSPQLSTNCLLNMSPKSPHSNLSNSFPITGQMAIPVHLRRTSSMSEYGTEGKPRRSSDTDFTRYGQLIKQQNIISEAPKPRGRPPGRRVHRHLSLTQGPCFPVPTNELSPALCYLNPPNGFISHNSPYYIRSPLTHRRHTDSMDLKPYWLQPPAHFRRARSVNCQTLDELITANPTSGGNPPSSCVSCLNSGPQCLCRANTSTYSVRIPLQNETRTSSVLGSEADTEPVKLWIEDDGEDEEDEEEEFTRTDLRPFSSRSSSHGLCFCQLIVLLISMQIVLGLAATGLGLYLRWRVPLLPLEECSFWAALPVSYLFTLLNLSCV